MIIASMIVIIVCYNLIGLQLTLVLAMLWFVFMCFGEAPDVNVRIVWRLSMALHDHMTVIDDVGSGWR